MIDGSSVTLPQQPSEIDARDSWSDLLDAIQATWPAHRYRDVGVVVGCSGGADSVALVRALSSLRQQQSEATGYLVVAHFNHRLRGSASDQDEDSVRSLAAELGHRFELERSRGDQDDEESARAARRRFLGDTAARTGARYIALAHTESDNVETLLYRLLRGTGPCGLSGMLPFRPLTDHGDLTDFVVVRPMLELTREMIRTALQSQGYAWREDQSNQSMRYRRNWIRNELIPIMQEQFPQATNAISRTIQEQQDWALCMETLADRWRAQYVVREKPLTIAVANADPHAEFDRLVWRKAVVVEALRKFWLQNNWPLQAMTRIHWTSLYRVLCGDGSSSFLLPGAVQVRRSQQQVTIVRDQNVD